ncbi:UDP-N-acetylmuramoyl-tripeptide--D-alanyl-D-alanine ligase [Bacillus marinisedimentorum]|uniref:UDP-N-acetylmuramoyl-tripeptide--D-alanyl-D- alanine ligase n=1 Tax=Bacillus marinisedimentorum TaxID=1821260 RepID=UPI000872D59F|nr:UDP-N-acetylmuramoyl-tripeptide--D-alanyl-D-alanine ligase [Bacillus marinisedimentorum]
MKLSVAELTSAFSDFRGAAEDSSIMISGVFTDSRQEVKKGLFIPIEGERFDGHDFLKEAIENGAVASLWKKGREVPKFVPTDFPLFYVEDTLSGLQKLAAFYLEKVNPYVVAVTGSNGKTTTKDMLEAVLSRKYATHKTGGNFNNHIGMPLTILAMEEGTELLILEMGMSSFGEISFLSKLARPDIAIITNIGESHMEQLGSRAGIAKAKMEIVDGLKDEGKLIIDGDEPLLNSRELGIKTETCGFGAENDYIIRDVSFSGEGQAFKLNNEQKEYFIPLPGAYNVKNAVFAIAAGLALGLDDGQITSGLRNIRLTGMRLERVKGKNGSLFINDAYNASPTSMKAAVETLKELPGYTRKILVLGDMYELGGNEQELHRSVADVIGEPITKLIAVGEKGKWIGEAVSDSQKDIPVHLVRSKEEAGAILEDELTNETVVLFKASRGMKLETLVESLAE